MELMQSDSSIHVFGGSDNWSCKAGQFCPACSH
jgi:hypothetical protein